MHTEQISTTSTTTSTTTLTTDDEFLSDAIAAVAARSSDAIDLFDVVIGGTRIRVTIADERVAAWARPALAWLRESPHGDADVQLHAVSGMPFPAPPWSAADYADRHRISHLTEGQVVATFDVERRVLNMYDAATRRGVWWCHDVDSLPDWEFGAPLRSLLTWALRASQVHLVHAAGVGRAGHGGVLISGRGGSGKSTSTLACIASGMTTVGDDYCAVDLGSSPIVHGVYCLAKVLPDSIGGSLADLGTAHTQRDDGKVHVGLGNSMCRSLAIRALVLPTVAERTGELQPLRGRDAFYRIAPSTMLQSELGGSALFAAMARLTEAVPAFTLDVGPDVDRVVAALESLLA